MIEEKEETGDSCTCHIDDNTHVNLSVVKETLHCELFSLRTPYGAKFAISLSRPPAPATSNIFSLSPETSRAANEVPFSRMTFWPPWKYYAHLGNLYVHLRHPSESWYVLIIPFLTAGKLIDAAAYRAHLDSAIQKTVPPKASRLVSEIRKMSDDVDFHIECLDGVRIPVHGLILKTYWPFFRTMMQNDCAESNDKVLRLDYPADWLEVLVSFIYGQDADMSFEQAAGLLVVAQMYQLPELVDMATAKIVNSPKDSISLEAALTGWKLAFEAQNEKATAFLAGIVAAKQSQFGQSDEEKALFSQLSTEEALGLYFATVKMYTLKK